MKKRNSHIELLRLISIVLIIVSHYCVHGVGIELIYEMNAGYPRFLLEFLVLGNLGTILFVLITGYYLIHSIKVQWKKILRLILQVFFYSSICYIGVLLLGKEKLDIHTAFQCFLPIAHKEYWFLSCYVVLYFFHPYINRLLTSFKRREYLILIGSMFFLFSICSLITDSDYYGNQLIQFILYYAIGGYLALYPDTILRVGKRRYWIMIGCTFIVLFYILLMDPFTLSHPFYKPYSIYLLSRTSPFAILFCVSFFDLFIEKRPYSSKLINFISPCILGVYLISDNRFFKSFLWNSILHTKEFVFTPYLIPHMIVSVCLIVIVCLWIDWYRLYFLEKPLFSFLDPKIDLLQEKIENRLLK